jgi:amino acid adenylation domain-containing protein
MSTPMTEGQEGIPGSGAVSVPAFADPALRPGDGDIPPDACLHELFAAQAARTPQARAVVCAGESLTYAELDARANRLAHHLWRLGVRPEAAVGVCLEWGPELVVALLGALKAGGVYVPLDPALPAERLAYLAEDSHARVVVTREGLAGRVSHGAAVRVDADAQRIAAEPEEAPRSASRPEHLAYVIYTSGTTGRPKGVAVEHRAAAAHLPAMAGRLGIVPGDRVLQFASSGFDVSLEQVFLPLLSGATLVLRGAEPWSAGELRARVRSLGITVANLPPAYWREVRTAAGAEAALPGVRLLLVGGDVLHAGDARTGGMRLLNGYGPTEAVVTATLFEVAEDFAGAAVPIGRPVPGHAAYVLDARGAPVAAAQEGELYLGGLLARGYLGRPGLTAERFVPDPLGGAGARLYRTGDRSRWNADGELEFLGRTDFQVKIRGFRIEPGEIEARLLAHAGVREAVVTAREDATGDPYLVAHYAGDAPAQVLRAHLAASLPAYMVPAAYARVDALPRTPSGKVDRAALPATADDAFPTRSYEAPVGPVEKALAESWAAVLGRGPVSRGDHFFELGGHSLRAMQVVSRVREALGVEVPLEALFERPVLADFARGVETAARTEAAGIERVDRTGDVPPSFAQQRLWFLEQLGGTGAAYHIPMSLRLRGELDRGALVRALDRIVARHEALRTTFPAVDGEPVQRIASIEASAFRLVEHDLHAAPDAEDRLRGIMSDEASAPFDLAHGPLVRGRLVRMAADDHVLLLTMHHIVSDGWSTGVLNRELGALYAAFARGEPDPLPPLAVQYADYAVWHRRWVEGPVLEAQAEYWRQTLSGAPELLELPTDHARPAKQDFAGASVKVELDEALAAALRTLSQRHGTTLYMTLLAGWAAVLARLSGQDDVVIGTPSANRGRAEVEELIGFFVNTLPVRIDLSDAPAVAALLARVKERALEAQRNQDIPFEQVVERVRPVRSLAYSPLFQVVFAWQNAPDGTLRLPGLAVVPAGAAESDTAKFDLTLTLWEDGGRIAGTLDYATALFDHATVERHAGYLRRVLREMAADDARPVDRLELLGAEERARVVVEWNRTEAAYPADRCIHELFQEQAARTPKAIAARGGTVALTYAELNARANRLARHLVRLGVGPEARVGVCLERGPELMVCTLAVLKAGGAYVAMDPAYPPARLELMLRDSGAAVLLTDGRCAAPAERDGVHVVRMDRDAHAFAAESAADLPNGVSPRNAAYVVYTSGSTGTPKGVAVDHASLGALCAWHVRAFGVTAADRGTQVASPGFDAAVWEVWPYLTCGASVHMVPEEVRADPPALRDWLVEHSITVSFIPTPVAEPMLALEWPADAALRWMLTGGDRLRARPRAGMPFALANNYGPTECTVVATSGVVEADGARAPSIGAPIDNTRVHVLDAGLRPLPVGVPGELCIGGAQVARGYLNRPALTAERFVPDPFSSTTGARLYRSGDRVRWVESAEVGSGSAHSRTPALTHSRTHALEYLGRLDAQVKVRGYRVEPGEIEARLVEHPAVREAVVVAREDAPGEKRLVAYVVGEEAGVDLLRAHLAERLPEHMVPAAYVRLETLPLTPNGKVDRKALPAPDADAFATRGYEAPSGRVEQAVSAIWAELLGAQQVGRRDHFFELGGHSLLAARVVSRVRQALGVEAQPGDVFERPVLADFARGLQTAARAGATAIERVERSGPLVLSFAQQRLWFLEQLGNLGSTYHIPMRLRLRGGLDRGALARSLDRIVARHEALRTTFPAVDSEPVQHVAPVEESAFQLVEHDLRASPDAEGELRGIMSDEAGAPFDLAQGPLFRGRLARMAADDHVLLLTMHHIVSDGWSTGVLFRELGALYAAFARGEPDPLPPLPVQYADYAAWHRRSVEGDVLEAQAAYWTRTLAGAPELLELPADRPRPPRQDFAGASLQIELDEALTAALRTLSQRHGTTLFMTLLAGWAVVLARLSGQGDVVVGTPSAGRGSSEVEGLIGFFVNTLALRVDVSGAPTVAELLGRVREGALEAQRHQDLPFEQVVERVRPARSLSHTPLFQVMLAWQEMSGGDLELPGIAAAPLDGVEEAAAPFDLTLSLAPHGRRIAGTLTYATALFDRATVERHAAYLRRALEAMAADENQALDLLPLLPETERRLVLEDWNDTDAAFPAGACVHDLFRAQAARTPESVALSWRGERWTYAELEVRANRLANALRRRGVGPEVRVGICLLRTPELVAAMVGVLGAGGAYVPLDPAYPRERLGYMLEDAGVTLVITESSLADRLPEDVAALLLLDLDRDAIAAESAAAPESGAGPENLSHVIFTSGSTGRPKGVMIRHSSVVVLLHWLRENVTDEERSSVLFSTSINFDVSVAEVFGMLAWGGKLVIAENALELATLNEEVVHVSMVPSAAAELLKSGGIPASVKTLNLGGEALPNALAQGLYGLETVEKVGNLYGPTEDTTYSTYYVVPRGAEQVLVGTPVANTRAYVLDHHLQPVPAGVVGELYLAGDGLSRGYANRPAMTAERFIPCPFGEPGARMYRVMDRVRWKESASVRECVSAGVGDSPGAANEQRDQPPFTPALPHSRTHALEYLGRIDFQVKVRGYRIELGEIEARLAEHPGVRAPVVLVREDAPGDRRLVAYYLADEPVAVDALKSHLASRLPGYMVPAAYVWMEAYPLTPNGKTDRRALPAPEGDAYAARQYEAPAGETEQAVAAIWGEVLGVERVGRGDDFFALGGHSLLAVRVVSRVRQALGVEAAPGDLFERPVLADFARGLESAARSEATAIVPVERSGPLALSFAQQRLWFLEQLGNLGSTYHIPMLLRLRGTLDRGALVRSLDRIVARHEALRTAFPAVDGEPVQHIVPAEESVFRLVEHDLRASADAEDELRRLVQDEASAPFDLEHGPLVRGRLVRRAADDHVLLMTMHHIVSDAWSMGVLFRELGELYAAFVRGGADPLPPLPVQYADYAVWHRRWVEGPVLASQAEYWRETLAGAPELLELPTDHPRPAKQDFAGASLRIDLDEALTAALKTLGQRHGTTLYMTLLAGWAVVLARLSGQDDVVVGTPSANRARPEVEELIGFFVNTLALRVDLSARPTVAELLAQVKAGALEAQRNQDIPFEQVVERVQPARSMAHSPLFQVMFAWQHTPGGSVELPGLTLAPADAAPRVTAKFDLLLSLWEDGGRITGDVEYATSLFERETVERWLSYLRRVLEAMTADDTLGVDRLPMLAEAERRLVLREWNATDAAYPREACVHELFEAQAARTPGAVAVVFEGERVTYAQLNARANRLAHHLRALGVGPDVRVGICVERSVEMVVGLLGILKAGGAYVPLDASYPVDRLRFMLADSAPAVLLTHPPQAATTAALSAGSAISVLDLTADEGWVDQPETNPGREGLGPRNLAHVLFTSGSTGRPKGVMLEHGSLVNRLAWMQDRYGMETHEALLQKTPFSFDVSFWEFFWPLMVGARLVMARPDGHRDPAYLADVIRREGITTAHFVPSMLQLFLERPDAEKCTGLLRVPVSGEAVSASLVRQFHERLPGVGLFNQYGPTESGEVTERACDSEAERVSIGRAIHNSAVYVLDRAGEPVPVGVAGELFIGGVALARGYLGRPRLTAERFVPDPFGEPGARMYRTGDLCRWLEESAEVRECVSTEVGSGSADSRTNALTHSRTGVLEYLGRTDFQVKVRGFRVELGEIEARLAAHPGVREAVVLAPDDAAGGKRLVAYFVGEALESEALRAHLSEQLPEYMVPAAFVRLNAFPVTPNGKLDRRALPAPDADAFAAGDHEAPLGETEITLAEIWSELLGTERVGRGDDFFALGGHSLLAVRVVSRVRQALGVEAGISDLFVRPVLADFARGLRTATGAAGTVIVPVERSGPLALSFAQQRLWFIEQMEGSGAAYHLPMHLRLKGELDGEALMRALDRIVARHEVLRTSFPETDGVPAQRISAVEESPFRLVHHDLRGEADAENRLRRLAAEEAAAPFDLAQGPLVRGRLIQLADDDHVLLVTMHHIVSDGWSIGVLTRELSALYAAFRGGRPDPLPPLPVQYADYAAWQRRWVEGEVLRRQADYWRETLSGAPELLELPTDHPRPARQHFAGAWMAVELDEALTAALKTLGQRHGATLYMTLLAGWAAVLARLSGQDEVVVGTPSANRGQSEIEGLIGFFVNTLALRVDLSGAPSVAELLGRVKERSLGAQQNQDIPFEQVVELVQPARSLAHTPLFQVMFAWQNAPEESLEMPGLAVGPPDPMDSGDSSSQSPAKFDLSLALWEDGGRIAGFVDYATALFERETVERWLGYLRRALEGMVADERGRVERLELLSDAERRRVVEEWNATGAAFSAGAFVHEQFEAQVERTPGAAALVFEDETLSYADLNERANRLAHHLRALGVGPDARVGICVERGPGMVVGVLAVLKAGGAYLPLDPAYPAERLRYMLEDGAPAALLTEPALRPLFTDATLPVVELGAPGAAWDQGPASNPGRGGLTAEHLVYVIYTSGSTGRPKGVRVPHGSLGATLAVAGDAFEFGAGDRVPSLASFAFDIWLFETLLPLLGGGTVRLVPRERVPDVPRLVKDLASCTVVHAVPALMRRIVEEVRATPGGVLGTLRHAFVGGDAVAPDLLEEMRIAFPAAEIRVLYGPTEAAIICAAHRLGSEPASRQMVGRPLGNAALYVVEPGGRVAPVGVAGELCLGGASVARDYLGRPGLTAERFVPDPFASEPGARLYRTGDRVRWLEESAEVRECVSAEVGSGSADSRSDALTHSRTGVLEFLGRTDHQVKVRGFRIEPGEIEARLAEHAGVREAVVLVREDTPGEKRLVAYVAGDETAAADVLRGHLSERLPEYMVPAAYVRLETLPLTPNGKVDRRALPAPEGDAFPARGYEAPSGRMEQAVAAIWAELLGVERVGRRDHFFELGGHSLLAVRVVSRVRQALGVETSPRDVFERPVLADFARGLQTAARADATAITPVERSGPLPLSFAQQRLWFLEQFGNLGSTYHIPMRLRLRGELDRGALVRALDRVVARHEALRTSFPTVDGEPVQHIAPVEESGFRLVEHDRRALADAEDELRRLVQVEAGAPFDLAQGPLVRGRLVRMAADDNVLLLTMHHIVADGWSTGVLFRELAALYTAFTRGEPDPLPPLPVQYADYAVWHRRWVEGPVLEAQAEYWTETLAGAPELLELPTDHPRPAKQDFTGGSVDLELDEALTAALKTLGQRHGTTLYMTLLAGWAAVLARLSGQDDVVVGTPSANRARPEVEELIGFFVNTLPVRVDLSGTPTVAEALGRVKERALEAQRNQDIPFEQVVERVRPTRSLTHTPLFQVMFAWQNAPGGSLELPGLALSPLDSLDSGDSSQVSAKFDLSLGLWEDDGRIVGSLEYATALFDRATVERHVGYLRRVLEEMAVDDAKPLERLELLSAAERRTVVEEWNATAAAFPAGECIHQLFEAQVARTPGAEAVSFEGDRLTYAELNARANRLAHHLRALGVGPDARVAICVERGPEMVAALLAILKAGGAYVPLDPAYPADRLRYMLEDSAPVALVTQSSLAGTFAGLDVPAVELDAPEPAWAELPETNVGVRAHPGHLAYVIYTSGSTGRPKGVMVEHRSLVNHTAWQAAAFGIGAGDTVLQRTSISFDASVWELWTPLATGARMLLLPSAVTKDPGAIARVIAEAGVTVAQFVPTLLQAVLGALPTGASLPCRILFCGGEPLSAALVEEARAAGVGEVVNLYGPTEATIDSTSHVCAPDGRAPAIGKPIANARIYVLDARGAPVPVGVAGELYVGGAGVTRGYLGRAGLTAERFVPDPFSAEGGARLYRTGDLGRWKESAGVRECVSAEVNPGSDYSRTDALTHSRTAVLEFLGRTDFQVKIRGFRIELGEIEAALRSHGAVRDALVLAREDAPGDRRLVAYYLADEPVAVESLKARLAERLPEHMVPAAYVWMEEYPRTPNGKTDRGALPAPGSDAFAVRGYEAPAGETEEAVAAIWADLLGVERVGRHDHFFQLGGNSLLATRLVFRINREMDVEISVSDVFEKPEFSLLAQHVLDAQLAQFDPDQLQELLALARDADVG